MSTTEELIPNGLLFGALRHRACTLFKDEKRAEEALHLSALMLLEPSLSTVHRAGFHLLLAYSEDNFLEHAQCAVELYQQLPDGPNINKLRQGSQAVLHQAFKVTATIKALKEAEATKEDVSAASNDEPQPQSTYVDTDVAACIRGAEEVYEPPEDGLLEPENLSEDDGEPEEEDNRVPDGGMKLSGDVEDEEIGYPSDLEDYVFKDDDPEYEMSEAERKTDH